MRRRTGDDSLDSWRDWGKRDLWGFWSNALEVDRVRTQDADSFAIQVLGRDAGVHAKEYRFREERTLAELRDFLGRDVAR